MDNEMKFIITVVILWLLSALILFLEKKRADAGEEPTGALYCAIVILHPVLIAIFICYYGGFVAIETFKELIKNN